MTHVRAWSVALLLLTSLWGCTNSTSVPGIPPTFFTVQNNNPNEPRLLVALEIAPNPLTVTQGAAPVQLTATARFIDGSKQNVTNASLWRSSDNNVVFVNQQTGLATFRRSGAVTVTATFNNRDAVATLTVAALDLVVVNQVSDNISVLAGNGDGTFGGG